MDYGFDDYQKDTEKVALYPGASTGTAEALVYVGLGLGEAGEVQGKIKKVIRDNDGVLTEEARKAIAKELGDLLWYIARTATEINYSLKQVAWENTQKLEDRRARGVIQGSGDNR